jgi:hypothetical protein
MARDDGRMVLTLNSSVHTVKLVNSSGTDVSGASVQISTQGKPAGSYAYVPLSAPVRLAPLTTYFVVTSEVSGADQFYDLDSSLQSTSGGATLEGAVYSSGGGYISVGSPGKCYGPVSARWSKAGVNFDATNF